MRLKRWESPRKEGRNDKGRGGSARQRQLKKQRQMLRKRLQEDSKAENSNQNKNQNKNNKQGGENISSPYFLSFSPTPNPPPPGVSTTKISPGCISTVAVLPKFSSLPSRR
jgi:hypothetical protein